LLLLQAELGASRKSLAMQESMMRKMSEQLLKEGEAVIALKAELAREQAAAKTLRDKLAKVCFDTSKCLRDELWGTCITTNQECRLGCGNDTMFC
jgi:hypothetical protein